MFKQRVRAAVRTGLVWAAGWAPIGLLMGVLLGGNQVNPDGFPLDDWLVPFTAAGFIGGALFSGVLRLAAGRRRFEELSLPRFGLWGAIGGLALGVVTVVLWRLDPGWGPVIGSSAAILVGSATLLSAVSAAGSLALARKAEERERLESGDTWKQDLPHTETHELPR